MRVAIDPRPAGEAPDGRTRVRLRLAAPRGFCAGVRRAIQAVEDALSLYGAPIYVRHAIVHNLEVVRALELRGAVFVEDLDEVPDGSVVIFSAHGVPRAVTNEARHRGLRFFDAVCPLVSKVHREVVRHHRAGRHIFLIGHADHPEIAGTLGQIPAGAASVIQGLDAVEALTVPTATPAAYAVQTTFSVEDAAQLIAALAARFPDLVAPAASDICYATTNRQAAIRAIAPGVDAVIVVGAAFSSNANRLVEVARAAGCPKVQRVSTPAELDWLSLRGARTIGLTAAASTPESSVSAIQDALNVVFDLDVEEVANLVETTEFRPVSLSMRLHGATPI